MACGQHAMLLRRVIMKVVKGSQAAIYRKYVPVLRTFLQEYAIYDIDNDGVLWCSKIEWNNFLFPYISDDDANAIGHLQSTSGAKTALEMINLVQRGKSYICHRVYNMNFVKNLERRRQGRNVTHFRLLLDGEIKTAPMPDSVYILKKLLTELGVKKKKKYNVSIDEACDAFIARLNQQIFPNEDSKLKEWNRVIAILECQDWIDISGGSLDFKSKD